MRRRIMTSCFGRLWLMFVLLAGSGAVLCAQVLTFNSSAGYAGPGSADGAGSAARFYHPAGVALDGAGNLYVADSGNNTIRKITSGGIVSTLAGLPGIAGSADGTGAGALFNQPVGVAVDGAGTVYVTDAGNNTIRKITAGGVVTTLAGTAEVAGSVNGTGTNALFNQPQGLAVDTATNLYVADYGNQTIRKITPALAVTTLAGSPGVFGSANATGTNALFYQPQGVAVDSGFNVYVTDTANGVLRKITQAGVVTTLAGFPGNLGSADGTGTNAQFYQPEGLALDSSLNLYVADYFNQTIRKITPSGPVTTLAGAPGASGSADGVTNRARFWGPLGMAVDTAGNLYAADYFNGTIRKVSPAGVVTTFAGSPSAGSVDGANAGARFNLPTGAAVDSLGNVYVADSVNSTIRKITPGGQVTTFAGSPGNFGSVDATGTNAWFNGPQSVAVDSANNVYVADTLNDSIRKISPQGLVVTLAGLPGFPGNPDGPGTNAQFFHPQGIALDQANNIYVADTLNHTIRKISPGGAVTTLAGLPGYFGSLDGTSSAARFNSPAGLALDSSGNIYVADTGNQVIREITPARLTTTLAGLAGVWGNADGANNTARFFEPASVAVDTSGSVYVADSGNQAIRLVTPQGTNWMVSTLPSQPVHFNFPAGITLDSTNGIYVVDSGNNTVRLQAAVDAVIPLSNPGVVPRPVSAIVSWTTPLPATSQVAYGTTPAYGSLTALDSTLVTSHAVLLTGLATNSVYFFNALSTAPGAVGAANGTFSTSVDIIMTSTEAVYFGPWSNDSSGADRYSPVYKFADVGPAGFATFFAPIMTPGQYDVSFWYSEGTNRSVMAPVTVSSASGSIAKMVNETLPGGDWQLLAGDQTFAVGTNGFVRLGNITGEMNKIVISDAVKFAYTPGQDLPVNGQAPAWWLNFYFGTTNVSSAAPAANGLSLLSDYVLGISPSDAGTLLNFSINPVPNGFQAVFSPWLNGRIYTLQSATNLAAPVWTAVPNLTVTPAGGQGVITCTNLTGVQAFYRLSVQLAP